MKGALIFLGWVVIVITVAFGIAIPIGVPVAKVLSFAFTYGGGFAAWALSLMMGIYIVSEGAEKWTKDFHRRQSIKEANKKRTALERKQQEEEQTKLLKEAGLDLDAS